MVDWTATRVERPYSSSLRPESAMSDLVAIRGALISVSDKTGLIAFASGLRDLGVTIISTGGTAKALAEAGIAVTPIEQITGMPEMMDGRVKTLHPKVHGGLLARRDLDTHQQAMREHGIGAIDLLCVNLYPFEQTIRKAGVTRDEAIEQIDIGGPAMVRSAAKNHQFVTVVTDPAQYDEVLCELRTNQGSTTLALRQRLAASAFERTAAYDAAISKYFAAAPDDLAFDPTIRLEFARQSILRYGENPHQRAALYRDFTESEPSVVTAEFLHGKELSYNNILDAAAALDLVVELAMLDDQHAAAAIVKHNNACGAAVAGELALAFERAHQGDPQAAFGGILALSRTVDPPTARAICAGEKFLEVIIAPGYHDEALAMLRERWKNVRLLAIPRLPDPTRTALQYRSILGGMLVQQADDKTADTTSWMHSAGPAPTSTMLTGAAFTWTVAKHLKSNAIAIGRAGQLLGAGPGQVDRVTSCRVAIEKAGTRLRARDEITVAASDAFFPFPDGPELLINAGVGCIVHPGGSKRDQETIDLCNARGVTCLLTGVRHFRH